MEICEGDLTYRLKQIKTKNIESDRITVDFTWSGRPPTNADWQVHQMKINVLQILNIPTSDFLSVELIKFR